MPTFLEHHEALRKARHAFTENATAIANGTNSNGTNSSTAEIESLIGQTVCVVLDVLDLVEQTPAEDQLLARLAEYERAGVYIDEG